MPKITQKRDIHGHSWLGWRCERQLLSKAGMNKLERSHVGGSLKICGIWTKWEPFGKIAQEKPKWKGTELQWWKASQKEKYNCTWSFFILHSPNPTIFVISSQFLCDQTLLLWNSCYQANKPWVQIQSF